MAQEAPTIAAGFQSGGAPSFAKPAPDAAAAAAEVVTASSTLRSTLTVPTLPLTALGSEAACRRLGPNASNMSLGIRSSLDSDANSPRGPSSLAGIGPAGARPQAPEARDEPWSSDTSRLAGAASGARVDNALWRGPSPRRRNFLSIGNESTDANEVPTMPVARPKVRSASPPLLRKRQSGAATHHLSTTEASGDESSVKSSVMRVNSGARLSVGARLQGFQQAESCSSSARSSRTSLKRPGSARLKRKSAPGSNLITSQSSGGEAEVRHISSTLHQGRRKNSPNSGGGPGSTPMMGSRQISSAFYTGSSAQSEDERRRGRG